MLIGFIGLGRMGSGMASSIVRSERDLLVYDANLAAAGAMRDLGAEIAQGPAEVSRRCDLIFTSLPGPAQIEQVVFGPGGLHEHLRPGLAHFDLSTSSLKLVRRLHEAYASEGAAFFDAPVSGGPAGAASGDLVTWVGGSKEVFEQHLDVLEAFSSTPHYVGESGAGTVTKLMHNVMGCMIQQCMAEAFSVGVKAGVDPLDLWQSMRLGLVGKRSPLMMLVNQFLPGTYDTPAMTLALAHKDVTLATEVARDLGVATRMASLTHADMAEAIARGLGAQDSRAFLKLQLERAGVEIAVDPARLSAALESLEG